LQERNTNECHLAEWRFQLQISPCNILSGVILNDECVFETIFTLSVHKLATLNCWVALYQCSHMTREYQMTCWQMLTLLLGNVLQLAHSALSLNLSIMKLEP